MTLPRIAVAVLTALTLAACTNAGSADTESIAGAGTVKTIAPADRAAAPVLEGVDLDGEQLSIADYRGKIVVVNMWGAWCGPCRKETPDLIASSKELSKVGVRFVGVNTGGDNNPSASAYVRAAGIPYPSFFDPEGKLLLNLPIPPKAIPSTLVLDPDGKVAVIVIGGVTQRALSTIVGKVVREQARANASASAAASVTPSS